MSTRPKFQAHFSYVRFRAACSRYGRTSAGPLAWALELDVKEPSVSDLSPFRQSKRILNVDAEVSYRTLDLRMAEQDLDSAEVARLLVYVRCLGPPERMCPVILPK